MKIIFYISRATDEITGCQIADPKWSEEELNEKIEHFNNENERSRVVVITADKYMEFLCNRAMKKVEYNKETLEEICYLLEQAKDCVEALK